ncbi:hypothetical protein ACUY2L_06865 [Corynebacterium mastitidis]
METAKEWLITLVGIYLAISADRRAWYKEKHQEKQVKPTKNKKK